MKFVDRAFQLCDLACCFVSLRAGYAVWSTCTHHLTQTQNEHTVTVMVVLASQDTVELYIYVH